MALQLSAALGTEVKFVDIPEAAAREAMQTCVPPMMADAMIEFYRLEKAARFEDVSPDFERVTGRMRTLNEMVDNSIFAGYYST